MATRVRLVIATFVLLGVAGLGQSGTAQTAEQAQHRLPPVIYSLDIPFNVIVAGTDSRIEWSVMGYHDDYEVQLALYDEENRRIHLGTYYPERETHGPYYWGEQGSKLFHFSTTVNVDFEGNQDITVRFFAVPPNDPIENATALSVIVPGGHAIRTVGTSGRQLLVNGLDHDEYVPVSQFFDVYDAVCGDGIAQFTAHLKEPDEYYLRSGVRLDTPPGVVFDFIAPTPTSNFDKYLAYGGLARGAVPGLASIWGVAGILGEFFDKEYLSETRYEYSGGYVPLQRTRSIRDRKLNMRLRGYPADNDWHLQVTYEYTTEGSGSYTEKVGPVRFPLGCFGSWSDNPDIQR